MSTVIFTNILNMFNNLRDIKCHSDFQLNLFRLNLSGSTTMFFSSTLTKLHIKVERINDCLHLLDGRFNQLETFYINVEYVLDRPLPMINEKVSCFSNILKDLIFV